MTQVTVLRSDRAARTSALVKVGVRAGEDMRNNGAFKTSYKHREHAILKNEAFDPNLWLRKPGLPRLKRVRHGISDSAVTPSGANAPPGMGG